MKTLLKSALQNPFFYIASGMLIAGIATGNGNIAFGFLPFSLLFILSEAEG